MSSLPFFGKELGKNSGDKMMFKCHDKDPKGNGELGCTSGNHF